MNNSLKVLVTGATGFIASHIILKLLNENYNVVGTVRKGKKKDQEVSFKEKLSEYTQNVNKLELVEIDLLDSYEDWLNIVNPVDYIIHVASPFPDRPPKNDADLVEPAKQSTLNILKAATEAKVKKMILTSSIAAVGYGKNKEGVFTEEDWTDETNLNDTTAYIRSKTIAEKSAWDFVRNTPNAVTFTSILPGFVLGPVLLPSYGTSVNVIKMFLQGKYPSVPNIGFSMVDVRDLADLHVQALFSPNTDNERIIGTDKYMSFKELASVLKRAYPDKKIPSSVLPNFVVRILANFDSGIKTILVDLNAKREFSNQKAQNLLNWKTRPAEDSILDCAKSLQDNNLI